MAEFYSARGWEIPPLPWTNLSPPFSQMNEVLKSGGIDITERSLRTFLDKGMLPGRKVAGAARSMVSEEGSDPF